MCSTFHASGSIQSSQSRPDTYESEHAWFGMQVWPFTERQRERRLPCEAAQEPHGCERGTDVGAWQRTAAEDGSDGEPISREAAGTCVSWREGWCRSHAYHMPACHAHHMPTCRSRTTHLRVVLPVVAAVALESTQADPCMWCGSRTWVYGRNSRRDAAEVFEPGHGRAQGAGHGDRSQASRQNGSRRTM